MYHYTYYSYEEFGRGYIGSRQSKVPPEQDTRYMGSFYDRSFKPTQKIILATHYNTKEEALSDESILHKFFDVVANPHFVNMYNAGEKFYRTPEDARNDRKKQWERMTPEEQKESVRKMRSGLGSTPEQRSATAKRGNQSRTTEQKKEISKKISQKRKEYWLRLTPEEQKQSIERMRSGIQKDKKVKNDRTSTLRSEKPASYQLWQCTVTGYASTSRSVSHYQKARGIDKSNRVRLDQ